MLIRHGRPRPRGMFYVLANRSSRGCGKTPWLSVAVATCATYAIYRRCASIHAFATRARAHDRSECVRTDGSYIGYCDTLNQQFLWIANSLMNLISLALYRKFQNVSFNCNFNELYNFHILNVLKNIYIKNMSILLIKITSIFIKRKFSFLHVLMKLNSLKFLLLCLILNNLIIKSV